MIHFRRVDENNQQQFLQLLEDNPMQGWINTALTRQPSYCEGQHYFGDEQAFLAEEEQESIGCYQLTTHQGFINGELRPLGYLNSLRVAQAYRHKIRIIKAGFEHLQHTIALPMHCYTSIASDNLEARRLLEKGIKGLPRYEYLGELCTLVISKRRGKATKCWQTVNAKAWLDFYQQQACQYQLAPYVSEPWFTQSTLTPLAYMNNETIAACAVLWQQQSFKQVKVMRYHPVIKVLRPFYNLYSVLTKRPCLPKIKQTLPQTFLAFFQNTQLDHTINLIADALARCPTPLLTLSLSVDNPQCDQIINAFKPFVYKTCIYRVHFNEPLQWQNRPIQLEAAIL